MGGAVHEDRPGSVATRLFSAHGYDGTSIQAVLAESGVSRGTLHHHFPGVHNRGWPGPANHGRAAETGLAAVTGRMLSLLPAGGRQR